MFQITAFDAFEPRKKNKSDLEDIPSVLVPPLLVLHESLPLLGRT